MRQTGSLDVDRVRVQVGQRIYNREADSTPHVWQVLDGRRLLVANHGAYSGAMSCAVGATGPNGGRRTTSSSAPKRTWFECPPGNCATCMRSRSSGAGRPDAGSCPPASDASRDAAGARAALGTMMGSVSPSAGKGDEPADQLVMASAAA